MTSIAQWVWILVTVSLSFTWINVLRTDSGHIVPQLTCTLFPCNFVLCFNCTTLTRGILFWIRYNTNFNVTNKTHENNFLRNIDLSRCLRVPGKKGSDLRTTAHAELFSAFSNLPKDMQLYIRNKVSCRADFLISEKFLSEKC